MFSKIYKMLVEVSHVFSHLVLTLNFEILSIQFLSTKLFIGSSPEVFLGKGFLKICHKVTGEHPSQSTISKKLLCNFIEIALRHGCSSVNLLHIFSTPFLKNTSGWLLLPLLYGSLKLNKTNNSLSTKKQISSIIRFKFK